MKPVAKKVLYAAFIFGTLLVVLLLALRSGDLESSIEAIGNMPMRYVNAGIILTFLAIFAQTLSTCSALRTMGYRIGLTKMFGLSILGEFYCYVTPGASGGQPMVIYQLYKRKVSVGDATSAQLVHHLFFQLALTLVTTVLGIVYHRLILQQVGPSLPVLVFGYCFNLCVLILIGLLCFTRRPVRWMIEKLTGLAARLRLKKVAKLREKALDTADQFYNATQMLNKSKAEMLRQLGCGLLRVLSLNSVMYCVYRGLGLREFSFGALLAMSVMQYTSAAYTPLPGASGAQEGVFALYFGNMFGQDHLFSGMLAWRFITYYLVLGVGVFVMLSLGANRQKAAADALSTQAHPPVPNDAGDEDE